MHSEANGSSEGKSPKKTSLLDSVHEISVANGGKEYSKTPNKPHGHKLRNGIIGGVVALTEIVGTVAGVANNTDWGSVSGSEIVHEAWHWPVTIAERVINGEPIPPYDYKATKGVIEENKMIFMSPEEYAAKGPGLFSEDNSYHYIPFSFEFNDGKTTHDIPYEITSQRIGSGPKEYVNITAFHLPKGTDLRITYDCDLSFNVNIEHSITALFVTLLDSEGNPLKKYDTIQKKEKIIADYYGSTSNLVLSDELNKIIKDKYNDPKVGDTIKIRLRNGQVIGTTSAEGDVAMNTNIWGCSTVVPSASDGQPIGLK
jgi:hypothetical protein